MSSSTVCIGTEGLCAGYGRIRVLEDIELKVEKGTILTLIGANGCGKSTLLKCLIGELSPVSGRVFFKERELASYTPAELSKKISLLMTGRISSGFMTSREIVEFGRYPYTGLIGRLSEKDKQIVDDSMELLGIEGLAEKPFANLSDGQRQLVMLARAVCQEPELLIMDEPTSFLDINYKLELLKIVRLLSKRGITVIMSLHELELAREISDTVVCIKNGRIFRNGPPSEIFSRDNIGAVYNISDFGVLDRYLFS